MLELLVAFAVPLVAFAWAVHRLFDDHFLGVVIASAGASTALAGLLMVLLDVERFRTECTIQSMVHNVTLPCDAVPGAYEILVPTLAVATLLNAGVILAGAVLLLYRTVKQLKQHPEPKRMPGL